MSVNTILQTIAYLPTFALRPFLAAFMVAVIAFWGNNADYSTLLNNIPEFLAPVIGGPPKVPSWFIHPVTLGILGFVALIEIGARKDPDIRMWFDEFDTLLKSRVSLVVTFSLVDGESAALLGTLTSEAGAEPSLLSSVHYGLSCIWSGITSAITWAIATFRKGFLLLLTEFDEDDTLGLQGFISWLEDAGVIGGIIFATIIPIAAIILFGLTLLSLFLIEKYMEYQEKKRSVPCPHCETLIHASAPTCYNCKVSQAPQQVGAFGQATQKPVIDLEKHKLQLVARKRCPVCATRLKNKSIRQHCSQCETVTFASAADVQGYLQSLRQELPKVMIVTFILGLIPLIGIIPAIIYYRFSFIASLRGYLPRSIGCLARWGVKLINLILIGLQPIPLLGAVMLPLMVITNYFFYQMIIERESGKQFGRTNGNKKSPSVPPDTGSKAKAKVPGARVKPILEEEDE